MLTLLVKYWKEVILGLLSVLCVVLIGRVDHWHGKYETAVQLVATNEAKYKEAAAQAADDNKQLVIDTERKWQEIAAKKDEEYNAKIASSNALVADYVKRMRNQAGTNQGSANSTGVPTTPGTPGPSNGTSEATVVPVSDLLICAENTIKAEEWQTFFKEVKAAAPQ